MPIAFALSFSLRCRLSSRLVFLYLFIDSPQDVIEKRAKARGLTADTYFRTNLLEQEVTAEDVAKEFVNLANAFRTTAGVATVDGGNIAASLR
jgi:hypothetical protein